MFYHDTTVTGEKQNRRLLYKLKHVQATEPLVKEKLAPLLEQYRPVGISSLKLDKFNIGSVAPKLDGVSLKPLLIVIHLCAEIIRGVHLDLRFTHN